MSDAWVREEANAQRGPTSAGSFPAHVAGIPDTEIRAGRYRVGFARTPEELGSALRLRYEIFNRELDEGLPESDTTGRDEDAFDAGMHHLLVWHDPTATVIGTYRMQTSEMAAGNGGFYTAGEFDLSAIPDDVLASAVEVGRACIAKEHRKGRVLHLLWKGLAAYLAWNDRRYLFGCCSLTGTDPSIGWTAWEQLQVEGRTDPDVRVTPLPGFECLPEGPTDPVKIPTLFRSYLDIGATVCGPPCLDEVFGTTDFLVLLNTHRLTPVLRRMFFG